MGVRWKALAALSANRLRALRASRALTKLHIAAWLNVLPVSKNSLSVFLSFFYFEQSFRVLA
jgi:hypothetical protein